MRITADSEAQHKVQFHVQLELIQQLIAAKRERPFFSVLPFTLCHAGALWTSMNRSDLFKRWQNLLMLVVFCQF